MKRRVFLLATMLFATACKGSDSGPLPGEKPKGDSSAAPQATGDVQLTGAGATFPFPLYSKWVSEFGKAHPGVRIDYQSIGSGGGIRQITERTVDFGASDAPMNDEQLTKAPGILHIPTCLGAVAVTYNLEGVTTGLQLTPEAVAGIFLGTITKWNDPKIASENPGAKLPDKAISSVHRSDGSGTTKIFVDYLSAVSEPWKTGPGTGTSVAWPGGLGAKGNEGVAGQVKSSPFTIGYVELAYAMQNGMSVAHIKNKAGKFVAPSLESTTAAAAGVKMPDDLRVSIVNAEGDTAYPIAGFTYLLVYQEQKDARKGKALVDFMHWSLRDGQAHTKPLHYAPLPEAVSLLADKKILAIVGPDKKPLLTTP
jgi:phosphate transport system substrate-binding protein